ncbi:hypothetical protein BT93_L0696 [Corymbia citriodora subsp. variegata]|uniref:CCHC-type domain-containing protein n=1 Tax=Corymbia citriodora subsp. variegata TaxID=360336 RepID=A0A8T0CPG3_CORYI|nr:hypothetical protein BT93_L0696 [Corymbia citriodora subsp. variegata]
MCILEHILGLPTEWKSEGVVKKIASKIGKVLEVKIEERGPIAQRVGKAKVEIAVNSELVVGQSTTHGGKKIWLDFKYERLPFYCYSCGKLGHYASSCKTIPYVEANFNTKTGNTYGNWLRAEVQDHSPFWDAFYEGKGTEGSGHESEMAQDIQDRPSPPTLLLTDVGMEDSNRAGTSLDQALSEPRSEKTNMGQLQQASRDVPLLPAPPIHQPHSGLPKKKEIIGPKPASNKKKRRFSPYNPKNSSLNWLDESKLMDTPIGLLETASDRVVVAGPKQPQGDK